jgi:serine/threonine protein kinase/WD40 repeat protein
MNKQTDAARWKQIDELLDILIDMEPAKRSTFLDQVCVDDDSLRKKLEALLAADQRTSSIIDNPVLHPPANYATHTSESVFSSVNNGDKTNFQFQKHQIVVGRYEILSRLGAGGMGEVWHAYDTKLRLDVALKTLRSDLTRSHDRMEALRNEVRNAREVISPNVCRIYDLVYQDDQEFISMEYIDGATLSAMLKEKESLSINDARDIAAQFLSGLEAIHRARLVHCDLKPENIMITSTGRIVLMDFGIAKQTKHEGSVTSGTLPYVPPDYLSDKLIDPKFDIFSAGVILAEIIYCSAINGKKPREEIWNIIHYDPQQLPESPWKSVIARAVSPNAKHRFDSAQSLSRALEEETIRLEAIEDSNPYPGLSAFTTGDAKYFFGREPEVEALIKKLRQLHLTALIGPSGAGKTSMLRAGLIPSLPNGWNFLFCQPGDSPFLNLGQALASYYAGDTNAVQKLLTLEEPNCAVELFGQWRQKSEEALLIIDRFEELFTLNSTDVQASYALMIERIAIEADVRVLLVMRDDFLIFCKEYSSLTPIFSELTAMLPLRGSALRRALVQPALKCGYRFENETLVDEIVSSINEERGALPLMAFAAARLWEKRDRLSGLLTQAAYREIGKVDGALARHADATLDRIGTEKLPVVREVFRNLITAENTRAVRYYEDVLSIFADKTAATNVLNTLIDGRLLTSFESPHLEGEKPKRRVEIIHESLITNWPRLVRWQTQDADSAQLRDELRQSAQQWERRNRSEDLLWTGTAFLEFQTWRRQYSGGLTTSEEAFSNAMAQRANKRRTRQRIALTAFITFLLGIIFVITIFWRESTTAKDQAVFEARRAEARRALMLGKTPNTDPSTKLAFAIASLELADTQEGRFLAMEALAEGAPARFTKLPFKETNSIEFSPDSNWMAVGAVNGAALLPWNGNAPVILENLESDFNVGRTPQFSSDGKFVIWKTAKDPRITKVWSLPQQKVIRTFRWEGFTNPYVKGMKTIFVTDLTGRLPAISDWSNMFVRTWNINENDVQDIGRWDQSEITEVDYSVNGEWVAYSKLRNLYMRSLNSATFGKERFIGTNSSDIAEPWFHPNGNGIFTRDVRGEIKYWSIHPENKTPVQILTGKGPFTALWLHDPLGSFLAVRRENHLLRIDLNSHDNSEPLVFAYRGEHPRGINFDHQRRWMSILWDSVLGFYPLNHMYPYTFKSTSKANWSFNVRFMPDGKSFVSGLSEEGIRIWKMPDQKDVVKSLWKPSAGILQPIDIDPTGKYVLAGTNDITSLSNDRGIYLVSLADGKSVFVNGCLPTNEIDSIAFSPGGRSAAAVSIHGPSANHGIQLWDLQNRKCTVLKGSEGKASFSVEYLPDGNLLSGDNAGNLYLWNLTSGSHTILGRGKGIVSRIAVTKDGRYVAANTLSAQIWEEVRHSTSELIVYDLREKTSRIITKHGNRVFSVAFDPSGTKLVTGDIEGVVRVGPIDGEPHFLIGSKSMVGDIDVHPNGNWIATSELFTGVVRLWPMPQGKPLHTLPYAEFLNRLRNLTNVRTIPDTNSSTGYRIEYAPFTGWQDVPIW